MSDKDHCHEHGCDCGEHDECEILVITDEDGMEHEFEVIAELEVDGKTYLVMIPLDEEEDEEPEVIIMRAIYDEDDNTILEEIEDDEEWAAVEKVWDEFIESAEEE